MHTCGACTCRAQQGAAACDGCACTHWHTVLSGVHMKKVDGGQSAPRDGLDGGWGRHARRARPAHPWRSTSPSLARMSDRHAGIAAGRTDKGGLLTQGQGLSREGWEHGVIAASQGSHPQPPYPLS
jgi:hypothetical protein